MNKKQFEELRAKALADWEALEKSSRPRIIIGAGTCGRASGALSVADAIHGELSRRKIDAGTMQVGCIGLCYLEPLVDIVKPGRPRISYRQVTPELIPQLIEDYLVHDNPRPDLALGTIGEGTVAGIPKFFDLPMLKPQVRIVLRNCGIIDPENMEHYIARGGYSGLLGALERKPEEVIAEVKKSGLRGRGGAGFPTGTKWQLCRDSPGNVKYIICNADEGDPGAFMNRALLEGDPHSVLEGMLIGAYAMGATRGFVYCRAEKPLAIERVELAIKQIREAGLIGENILGSGFSFDIELRKGAGAFVCGEETALMASIEGKRGMPRPRPPFPAQAGLWGKPTNINNVETWADVAAILQRGGDWYASHGVDKSKGTKTFALAGKINNTGLIEVPLGTNLQDIVYEVGGGVLNNKKLKAVQAGGPSGGCIPASSLNIPVEYESLTKAGAIIGSGGMIVMDEDTCMVDVARFFLSFVQSESCGKCVMCRVGTKQMLGILENICSGKGKPEDIDLLLELSNSIKAGSLCGLGQTSPNPVLTTLRYFRHEYEEHILRHKCRAAACRGMMTAPCTHTCPAGIDIPRYLRFIAEGKPGAAVAVIREKIPFPTICGLVCFHPCESKCRRGQVDEAVAIRMLKGYAAAHDTGEWKEQAKSAPKTGKRVAIVGAGPAGLTSAYYLTRLGHSVTVFEALPEAGGMMRYGIPDYRLPKDQLSKEIKEIEDIGVEIKTNTRVASLDDLFKQGFNSIFVAVGAHQGMNIGVEGEKHPRVIEGVEFWRDVSLGKKIELGDKVAVIGGGNAAIDSARVARRLGAKDVTIIYRRTRLEMPASEEEITAALAEGIQLVTLAAPAKITSLNSHVKLESVRMKLGSVDTSGRRRPEPVQGSEFTAEYDTIIAAIGQKPHVPEQFKLEKGQGDTIKVDQYTLATSTKGVFAGGDAVSGPASVIQAIADGRQAATSIDQFLGGKGIIEEKLAPPSEPAKPLEVTGEKKRPEMPELPPEQRIFNFNQVELGYNEEMACAEAERCLRCDLEERE